MKHAIWRPIPGFARYSVSDAGDVRREVRMHNTRPGPVAQRLDSHGYLSCNLMSDGGRQKKLQVHVLVAAAFLGPRLDGFVVCHGKAGRLVNRVTNLRYDTQAANIEDARAEGTMLVGSRHPSSKLDERRVLEILELLVAGELTHKEIGARYCVDGACIGRIAAGATWRHVPRPPNMSRRYSVPRTRMSLSACGDEFRSAKAPGRHRAAAANDPHAEVA